MVSLTKTSSGESTPDTLKVLREMRVTLAKPEAWFQGGFAGYIGEQGDKIRIDPSHASERMWLVADADCFCLIGAGLRAEGARSWRTPIWEIELLKTVNERGFASTTFGENCPFPFRTVPAFNDYPGRTHADVLQVIDRTIERLEGELAPMGDPDEYSEESDPDYFVEEADDENV